MLAAALCVGDTEDGFEVHEARAAELAARNGGAVSLVVAFGEGEVDEVVGAESGGGRRP